MANNKVKIEAVEDGNWRASVTTPEGDEIYATAATIDKALQDLSGMRIQQIALKIDA